MRLRYEDLCAQPQEELARIARFAGLQPPPGPVDFHLHVEQEQGAEETTAKLEVRLKGVAAVPDLFGVLVRNERGRR